MADIPARRLFAKSSRHQMLGWALACAAAMPLGAQTSATAAPDGAYGVASPTTRPRTEVMKSFAQWHISALADTPDATVATWSADNGLLTERESDRGVVSQIKFNDVDLASLRASLSGQWQIQARTSSGRGAGFTGHLRGDGEGAQSTALQALQDIYDLAYSAQQLAAAQVHCDFGRLDEYRAQAVRQDTNLWSEARRLPSGRTTDVQILYEIADLVHGHTAGGGQAIGFAAQSLTGDTVSASFVANLTSNTGAKAQYNLAEVIANASDPLASGPSALLTREPFGAGQCIAQVSFENVAAKPLPAAASVPAAAARVRVANPVSAPRAAVLVTPPTAVEESQPPLGKKLPALLPLPTTPSLDESCPYPKEARERGETGVVLLLVHVGPDGSALDTAVDQSSGSESLDRSTAACVRASGRFPVRRTGSKPTSYWGRMKFNWSFGQ